MQVARRLSPSTDILPLSKPGIITPVVSNTQFIHVRFSTLTRFCPQFSPADPTVADAQPLPCTQMHRCVSSIQSQSQKRMQVFLLVGTQGRDSVLGL